MDLATVLKSAQHQNLEIRSQAELYLSQAVDNSYGPFLLALTEELATEGKDVTNRQLAGLYIKNMISAQDETLLAKKLNQWHSCDPALKNGIREGFLVAIKSQVPVVCHTAAQVLAAFGAVDIPDKEWPGLLPALFQNINDPNLHESCKVASLEALGYMLDTMSPDGVESATVNQMLTCIIEGNRIERSPEMRLAAITALNNSIEFARANFDVKEERDALITAICFAIQAKEIKIRERAFECCAEVAEFYYNKLTDYIETLYQLSINSIRLDEPTVGMQAIEFWNTICDQEYNIMEDIDEGDAEPSDLLHFTEKASSGLVPLLLECMTKQEEDLEDEDTWNISMAAATLLESVAKIIQDSIINLVLPYVTQNINNQSWRLKEAAIMAFGMILEGPTAEKLEPLVRQALPILIQCLGDQNPLVRDTSAWTIGRICELYKSALTHEILPLMIQGLGNALSDSSSKVVSRACYAVHSLAEACSDENEATSNVLSHFMPEMLQKLLAITNKKDWDSDNVNTAAFEAINKMVENSALDMLPIVQQLLVETLKKLELTFSPQMNHNERMNIQSSLCGLVGEIVKKLELHSLTEEIIEKIMQLLFQVFSTKGAIAHEDAFIAIGYLATKMGPKFSKYLPYLQSPLITALRSVEETGLCTVAVGVVGDLCRALNHSIMAYCDDIMHCLLELLQSPVLNRSVKPHVISVFADIAMAVEGDFDRYSRIILGILKQAGEVNINTNDEDLIEYINTLRNSIMEAYTGILQGLKAANKQDTALPSLDVIVDLLKRSAEDPNKSNEVLKSAVGLLGDLGQIYGTKVQHVYNLPFVANLLEEALQNGGESQEIATWARSVIVSIQRSK